ncbi:MAG: hypothetical protein Q4F72_08670 [Desulfovibrionaceae bacterium]|nr:hypothetical protein [Desulfovibrionaceae bacterium]
MAYAYTLIEVGGIQKYILSTRKLKEMIGGSEMIESLKDYCLGTLSELGLKTVTAPQAGADWCVVMQQAAGALRLLFADRTVSERFLHAFGGFMLERCPGLPLYAATADCEWTSDGLKKAREDVKERLEAKRGRTTLAPHKLWPFSRMAPLDGLPAVGTADKEYVSLPSKARRSQELIDGAREKLRSGIDTALREVGDDEGRSLLPPDTELTWIDNVEELLKDAPNPRLGRVALIHADGNSMGVLFRNCIEANRDEAPEKQVAEMLALSETVDRCTRQAFREALCGIVRMDLAGRAPGRFYTVPARPLVLGGDDVTVLVRADLAFAFTDLYAAALERAGDGAGIRLSAGAGMVVMTASYPFSRAFALVEQLTDSAKKLTDSTAGGVARQLAPENGRRPSSMDYLVLTNDVEQDLDALRDHTALAADGSRLTGRPFLCGGLVPEKLPAGVTVLSEFLKDARLVLGSLPASHLRAAAEECRKGRAGAQRAWDKLHENVVLGLGGRGGSEKLHPASFERIFPKSFFTDDGEGGFRTLLGDYIELRHLQLFEKKGGR